MLNEDSWLLRGAFSSSDLDAQRRASRLRVELGVGALTQEGEARKFRVFLERARECRFERDRPWLLPEGEPGQAAGGGERRPSK